MPLSYLTTTAVVYGLFLLLLVYRLSHDLANYVNCCFEYDNVRTGWAKNIMKIMCSLDIGMNSLTSCLARGIITSLTSV